MTIDIRTLRDATASTLGLTTNLTVVVGGAMIDRVIVTATATGGVTVLDGTSTTPSAANTVVVIPAVSCVPGAIFQLRWPVNNGITVLPGGGTVCLSYNPI